MFLMADLSLPVSRGDDNLLFFPDSQLVDPESWEQTIVIITWPAPLLPQMTLRW